MPSLRRRCATTSIVTKLVCSERRGGGGGVQEHAHGLLRRTSHTRSSHALPRSCATAVRPYRSSLRARPYRADRSFLDTQPFSRDITDNTFTARDNHRGLVRRRRRSRRFIADRASARHRAVLPPSDFLPGGDVSFSAVLT